MGASLLPDDEHNRRLAQNAHPEDWRNPSPSGRYNLVVVGGGTAGLVSAAGAAALGARVALVERDLLGGDCLNHGCVPSKVLLRSARAARDARNSGRFGVRSDNIRVDFPAIMERMRRVRADISPNDSARRFKGLGVDVYFGHGKFVGRNRLDVDGAVLEFRRAIVATGARAAIPDIPGLAEVGFFTNETVFSMTELPRRLAVVGGGPIGCELAQAFARFGAAVVLIEQGDRILPRDAPEAAAIVASALQTDGVDLRLQTRIVQASHRPGGKSLVLRTLGTTTEIEVDGILVGIGRAPNVEGLGLDAAGVEYQRDGVRVDDHLRTSNRGIFAVGDVCSMFKFTHAADAMARLAIRNALFLGRAKASALVIPWCTYTDPEVAHVGLNPIEARRQGVDTRTFEVRFEDVDRAILDGNSEGFVRVHTSTRSDNILGATIVGRGAGEMISEITLAMTTGCGLGKLSSVVHPYPTMAEAIRKCGDQFQRTRLTPNAAWLLRKWLEWTR